MGSTRGWELLTAKGGGTLAEPIEGQAPVGAEGIKALMKSTGRQAPLGGGGGLLLPAFGKMSPGRNVRQNGRRWRDNIRNAR